MIMLLLQSCCLASNLESVQSRFASVGDTDACLGGPPEEVDGRCSREEEDVAIDNQANSIPEVTKCPKFHHLQQAACYEMV